MSKKTYGIQKSMIAELPRGEFAQWEISLHSELVHVLHEVSNPFPLEQWINSRLGHKIEIISGVNGTMIHGEANYVQEVADAAFDSLETSSKSQPDAFANLPLDRLRSEEVSLREAIYDYIASSGQGEVTLADLIEDKDTQQIYTEFAQAIGLSTSDQISLDNWISRRISKEMEFSGSQAKRILLLKPEGEDYLRTRAKTDHQQNSKDSDYQNVVEEKISREEFFSRLSVDCFTATELALREAIYKYLVSVDQDCDVPLPDVTADPVVTETRMELAREHNCSNWKQIGLHDWIKKRLENEMQIVRSTKPWTLHLTEVGRREKFLAGLPKESFTDDEVQLRSVLVDIVDRNVSGKLSLATIRRRPDVSACIEAVLPSGCPLSLEEWIKTRIASDIDISMGALERVGKVSTQLRTTMEEVPMASFTPGRRKVQHSKPFKDSIIEFIDRFGLDTDCERLLRDLPWELQEDIMVTFNPKLDTENVAALFTKFARSRSRQAQSQYSVPKKDNIEEFIARFGLDAHCEKLLRDLPFELQEDIIAVFNPRPGVGNVAALFTTFVRTRSLRAQGQDTEPKKDNIDEFIERFGLDVDCERLLRDLSWELQEDIMVNFNPTPDIENKAALFTKFARTRTLRSSAGDERTWKRTRR